ncbi:MAG: peptide-N-glycosidase F-related protein [Myxococcota bacterium]
MLPMKRALAGLLVLLARCSDGDSAAAGDAGAALPDAGSPRDDGGPAPDLGVDAAPAGQPFDAKGPFGATPRALAAPFVLPTLDGDWDLQAEWSGLDSYLFFAHAECAGCGYYEGLWASSPRELLELSPERVHYFFLSYEDDAEDEVVAMKQRVDEALDHLDEDARAHWSDRLHYVRTPALDLDGWVGDVVRETSYAAFAIDRFQRLRETGYLVEIDTGDLEMYLAGDEARYFDFEWERQQALEAEDATVVSVIAGESVGGIDIDVELPDADAMAGFDTLELDIGAWCEDHRDENCGEWDYLSYVYLCDADDPAVCDIEIGRWITTYHREGRWVIDASDMLAHLAGGGTRRIRWAPGNAYVTDFSLRLSRRGKGGRPSEALWLWGGGAFNQDYNALHAPITIDVPGDVARVELYAVITGHGWGAEAENCAEFCNHTHHFTVNDASFVKEHPEAGTATGCMDRVGEGVVPNQYGTWPFGRGGWCPGFEVQPWVVDVTDAIVAGGENVLTYRALLNGEDYVPEPADPPVAGGFAANINLVSWLVYWR